MICQRCGSARMAGVRAKCSDRCDVAVGNRDHDGYVPRDMGIGGGDYIDFDFCLDCGMMKGNFPIPQTELESLQSELEE